MRRFLFALIAMATFTGVASATNYVHIGDGIYQNGSSYYGQRTVFHSGYFSCGYYYQPHYTYEYYQVNYAPPQAPADWRAEYVKSKAQRDEAAAFERAMGIPPSPYPSYGGYSYNNLNLNSAGLNGSTVQGYGLSQAIVSTYNPLDPNVAAMLYQRATSGAGQVFGQSMTDYSNWLDAAHARDTRLLEVELRKRALIESWNATRPSAQTQTQFRTWTWTTQADPAAPARQFLKPADQATEKAAETDELTKAWYTSVQKNNCADCHNGAKNKFKVQDYLKLSFSQVQDVWKRIDPDAADDVRMPRTMDGKAGKVTPTEFEIWRAMWSQYHARPAAAQPMQPARE